jgi:hypothetical protein
MAVGAEQNALARLGSGFGQRARHALEGEMKLLGTGIEMMKLENLLTSVISADQASTSGLLDQLPLYRPSPL